jgi:hypothetical protein
MLIDCDSCAARGPACGECVVSAVLGVPPGNVDLDADERRAIAVLADAGMVPHLLLATGRDRPAASTPEAAPIPGTESGDDDAERYWPVEAPRSGRRRVRWVA